MNDQALLCVDGGNRVSACRPDEVMPAPLQAGRRLEDRQFLMMREAFEAGGGLVSGDAVARYLRNRWDQPIYTLAKWIVARQVVNITWQSQLMLPMFQFDLATMSVRRSVSQAIAELSDVLDDWSLDLWFAQPSTWLGGRAPVNLIDIADGSGLGAAARADRFIARG